jgi:hypothetical protein
MLGRKGELETPKPDKAYLGENVRFGSKPEKRDAGICFPLCP